ncbi:hypothetical protein Hanom_Chr04g00362601 [Helianthus anomalus]
MGPLPQTISLSPHHVYNVPPPPSHLLTYASMGIDCRSKYCSRIRVHNTSNKLKYYQSFGDNQGKQNHV